MRELKKTLREDARLILQLKGVMETYTDKGRGLPFKPEDRELILQVGVCARIVQRKIHGHGIIYFVFILAHLLFHG